MTEEAYPADTTHLNRPIGLFMDNSNNLFVAEDFGERVLKYNAAGTNLLALGTAGLCFTDDNVFCSPKDMGLDASGNIWVADGNRVVEYNAGGTFMRQFPVENPWESGPGNDRFNYVTGIVFDGLGRMYVADSNNQRVQVFTFSAGAPVYNSTIGVTGQEGGDNAHFSFPYRLAVDSSNRVYVVDQGNNRVQRCTRAATWSCVTFASGFNTPHGITIDNGNNVFIADTFNGRIRKCLANGVCSDFVTGTYGFYDLEADSAGNVYGAATYEGIVAKYNSGGAWQGIFLGEEFVPYLTDASHYYSPRVAIDNQDNIIIVEETGQRLLKLDSSGNLLWSVGVPGVDAQDNIHLNYPHGVAVDASGKIYVADNNRVQIFSSAGIYQNSIGGSWGAGNYQFEWASGIAVDSAGIIYVADCPNDRVQVYNSVLTYVGTIGQTNIPGADNAHLNCPIGVGVDASRNVYVADAGNNRVQKFNSSRLWQMTLGTPGPWGSGSSAYSHFGSGPEDVAVDAQGRIFVADIWNNRVQVFNSTGGYLTTIAGNWGASSGDLRGASGVDVDSQGNVYVSDLTNHRIQKFSPGVPGWQQVNLNGFGTQAVDIISTLGTFKNSLYAGTTHWDGAGGQIWMSANGTGWSRVMVNGFGNPANYGIDHLIEFNGNLYAGTWSDEVNGGEVWRSSNGTAWAKVVDNGFGDLNNAEVFRFEVFNNVLYASTWHAVQGGQVWRSSNGTAWAKVVDNGFGDPSNVVVSFEVFGGNLYAGTLNGTSGGQIWRSDTGTAGDWQKIQPNGFGAPESFAVSALAAYNGYLYAATGHLEGGGTQIWRCQLCNNTDWQNVTGSWPADSRRMPALETKSGMLYAVIGNGTGGFEVWQTKNGTSWEQVGFQGFEGSNNRSVYWDNAFSLFQNELYLGTIHYSGGGQIWRTVPVNISGNAGAAGVTLSYTEGTPKTVVSQPNGSYSFAVPYNWSGTVTPSHACFTFTPASRNYNSITVNQPVQDYSPAIVPGCADVDVLIGGTRRGRFGITPHGSARASFAGLDGGPVKIESTNALDIMGAERLIYKVNNVATSFSEMMGMPNSQLDNTYWLPWYNNVELDTQLRFANVSGASATVHVYIGGNEMTGSPFTLAVGESTRKSFPGINAGPVQIVSDHGVPIVAAERLIYKVNGVAASFTEMMALPNNQLDSTYWLPWYNNADLDTQLRFANVSGSPAAVHVFIGGAEMTGSPFTLDPGASTRKSFPGVNNGPVQIVSDQNIVAAERLIYKVNGVNTSFSEMLALPNSQLNTTYWLPLYNNRDLDTQLRFANVHDTQTATVHVYIGGVEMAGSPFSLLPGASTRKSFVDINAGPVQIVSDVPIVAAERLIYKVNNIAASFSEMMALPNSQLDNTYWLPWYNNRDLDTQLRFGMP